MVAWARSSSPILDDDPATVTAIQATIAMSVTAPIAAVTMGARVSSVRDSIGGDPHSITAPATCATKRCWWGSASIIRCRAENDVNQKLVNRRDGSRVPYVVP
ncbi:hypothetical protein BH23CHL4_BH23CHL4_01380 [soil metagenome]